MVKSTRLLQFVTMHSRTFFINDVVDNIEKERMVVALGINSYVYRDDIENYIDNIAKDVVKIIEFAPKLCIICKT